MNDVLPNHPFLIFIYIFKSIVHLIPMRRIETRYRHNSNKKGIDTGASTENQRQHHTYFFKLASFLAK